jgi:hypothetical protein
MPDNDTVLALPILLEDDSDGSDYVGPEYGTGLSGEYEVSECMSSKERRDSSSRTRKVSQKGT